MALFGISEKELVEREQKLDTREKELNKRDSDLVAAKERARHEQNLLHKEQEALAEAREQHEANASVLEKRRQENLALEAKAKANFADAQREAFKEVVEQRQAQLDSRQKGLDALAERLAADLEKFHAADGELAKRELAVAEREQKADAGFADKTRLLAEENQRQHAALKAESERLRSREDALSAQQAALEADKEDLRKRVAAVTAAEQKRDAGFADERAALDKELVAARQYSESKIGTYRTNETAKISDELSKLREEKLAEIARSEEAERKRLHKLIETEIDKIRKDAEDYAAQVREDAEIGQQRVRDEIAGARRQWNDEKKKEEMVIGAIRAELAKHKGELDAQLEDLTVREAMHAAAKKKLESREANLDDTVAEKTAVERKNLKEREAGLEVQFQKLREQIKAQDALIAVFDTLKRRLGDKEPEEVLNELTQKTNELRRIRAELATRPTEEVRTRMRELEKEKEKLSNELNSSRQKLDQSEEEHRKFSELKCSVEVLTADRDIQKQKAERFESAANEAQAELNRLRAAYERPAEVEARHKEIEMPHIGTGKAKQPVNANIDEMTWLTGVGNACDTYGLHFNPRILKAFHTALKTAEWSPLTVLAGVSGTGKSELPRLYSHFGGLYFEPLSVQPNWDSQESMLGFFNSIDNKFDAQAVLRFLAQSQKPWSNDYPGLQDAVCLVLLDEMNLAHPELYFAEFLSKLELRRGRKGNDVPFIPVKIGAGMKPYELPLGRNVLWTGTMNQDETTKSLSDKVLDRSIIINFPRPTELKRRLKLNPLDGTNRGPTLHKSSWQGWLAQGSNFTEEEVKPFKDFIEKMNDALAVSGRALGHRVWQSIEYYMANYPDVRAAKEEKEKLANAMHIAFEDQLVQKVMPKLRGIDTRGKSRTECLDKIREQICVGVSGKEFNLTGDFDLACELGHGQFIWQSANYLNNTETKGSDLPETAPTPTLKANAEAGKIPQKQ